MKVRPPVLACRTGFAYYLLTLRTTITMSEESGKTLSQFICERVTEEIVRGELAPGMRLDEQSLADRFGVSRSPIRDALRQLAATQLVLYVPHRGFSVAAVEPSELDGLFETACEIEALCAKLCALRATPAERKQLEVLHTLSTSVLRAKDERRYSALNDELHNLIYAGTHNGALAEIAVNLRQRLAPFRARLFFTIGNRMQESHREHGELIAAIIAQDADASSKAMHEHAARSAMNVQGSLQGRLARGAHRRSA
jgi:DNA-binding GntR family transcriptional regulator